MKTHEPQNNTKSLIGSVKMLHNHTTYEKHKPYANALVTDIPIDHRLHKHDNMPTNNNNVYEVDSRMKKFLSKTKEEDLKFIDTSQESDYPPILPQESQYSLQDEIISSVIAENNSTKILLENENSYCTNGDVTAEKESEEIDGNVDTAVEESSSYLENQV